MYVPSIQSANQLDILKATLVLRDTYEQRRVHLAVKFHRYFELNLGRVRFLVGFWQLRIAILSSVWVKTLQRNGSNIWRYDCGQNNAHERSNGGHFDLIFTQLSYKSWTANSEPSRMRAHTSNITLTRLFDFYRMNRYVDNIHQR